LSRRNLTLLSWKARSHGTDQGGFTLVELLVTVSLVAIIFATFASFFTNYLILYSKYQTDAADFTELAGQSQRIADVLRGVTDITNPGANTLTVYAYFSPNDTYVSQVSYFLSSSGKQLMATITPMTANPPTGTLITSKASTYTILSNYTAPTSGSLFQYYDGSGTLMTQPITDEHSILQIQVNLSEPQNHSSKPLTLTTTVSLRNRKTNL